MKRLLVTVAAALGLLLSGCASSIRSDVTTFHQWPANLPDKSYVFEAPPPQDDTLELRSYQNVVRGELGRLGFREVGPGTASALKVAMRFSTTDVPVRVVEPMYPYPYYGPMRYAYASPFYRPYWGARHYRGSFYSPFYDPFWHAMPMYSESVQHYYKREVQVAIKAADGRRLFDVTVHNTSRDPSSPMVMPALVQSAFVGFPGVSGVARTVELKREG